jgi:phosphate transport system substrate-binding protein
VVSETVLKRSTAALLAVFLWAAPGAAAELSQSGSTMFHPLMVKWAAAYSEKQPGTTFVTQASGSGAGIADAIAGRVELGASDAPLKDEQIAGPPASLNIPLAVGAQQIDYNLPEVRGINLRLSGDVLAGIYLGKIFMWDDKRIADLNPQVELPHHRIIPIHRSEGSGDTFLFTSYLAKTAPEWAAAVKTGTKVNWPAVDGGLEAIGNNGVAQLCDGTAYSIAYIGISWLEYAKAHALGVAALQNAAGRFLPPSSAAVGAAVAAGAAAIGSDGRLSLVDVKDPGAYPIVNLEYGIVLRRQHSPADAAALKDFLNWAVDPAGGNRAGFLDAVHFAALPDNVRAISRRLIASIE